MARNDKRWLARMLTSVFLCKTVSRVVYQNYYEWYTFEYYFGVKLDSFDNILEKSEEN